jgi:hypothetical protein
MSATVLYMSISPDGLVKALGPNSGISKPEVSRICADMDLEVPPSATGRWPGRRSGMCSLDATK